MQIIHFQYKDDDSTYMMNNRLTGIINAGVYRGYNLDSVSGRDLLLKGDSYEVLPSGVEENNVSVLVTPQGCVIKETDMVQITLEANSTANPRVDLIYCQHNFTEVAGGTTAIYGVRSGTVENPPKIQLKKSQVAIAYVTVPAGWNGGNNLVYKRMDAPNFSNDENIAKLNGEQTFTEEVTLPSTKKVFATANVVANVMTSETLKQDLYELLAGDNSQVSVNSFNLGSTYGKIVQIVLYRPCVFSGTGQIYTPNGVDSYYTNKGDMITIVDITNGPLASKKWLIASTQSLKRDANGQYLFDNNIVVDSNRSIQMANMRLDGSALTNQDTNGNFQSNAYIIFRNDVVSKFAGFGLSVGAFGSMMMRLEDTTDSYSVKYGASIQLGADPIWGHHYGLITDAGVKCKYLLANGRFEYTANINADATININVDEYDYIELYPQGNNTKVNLNNVGAVGIGKILTILNRNDYTITFPSAGYGSGPDDSPTAKDLTIGGKCVAQFVKMNAGKLVRIFETAW